MENNQDSQILDFVTGNLQKGIPPQDIVSQLVELGVEEQQAVSAVQSAMQQGQAPTMKYGGKPTKKQFYKNMLQYKKGGAQFEDTGEGISQVGNFLGAVKSSNEEALYNQQMDALYDQIYSDEQDLDYFDEDLPEARFGMGRMRRQMRRAGNQLPMGFNPMMLPNVSKIDVRKSGLLGRPRRYSIEFGNYLNQGMIPETQDINPSVSDERGTTIRTVGSGLPGGSNNQPEQNPFFTADANSNKIPDYLEDIKDSQGYTETPRSTGTSGGGKGNNKKTVPSPIPTENTNSGEGLNLEDYYKYLNDNMDKFSGMYGNNSPTLEDNREYVHPKTSKDGWKYFIPEGSEELVAQNWKTGETKNITDPSRIKQLKQELKLDQSHENMAKAQDLYSNPNGRKTYTSKAKPIPKQKLAVGKPYTIPNNESGWEYYPNEDGTIRAVNKRSGEDKLIEDADRLNQLNEQLFIKPNVYYEDGGELPQYFGGGLAKAMQRYLQQAQQSNMYGNNMAQYYNPYLQQMTSPLNPVQYRGTYAKPVGQDNTPYLNNAEISKIDVRRSGLFSGKPKSYDITYRVPKGTMPSQDPKINPITMPETQVDNTEGYSGNSFKDKLLKVPGLNKLVAKTIPFETQGNTGTGDPVYDNLSLNEQLQADQWAREQDAIYKRNQYIDPNSGIDRSSIQMPAPPIVEPEIFSNYNTNTQLETPTKDYSLLKDSSLTSNIRRSHTRDIMSNFEDPNNISFPMIDVVPESDYDPNTFYNSSNKDLVEKMKYWDNKSQGATPYYEIDYDSEGVPSNFRRDISKHKFDESDYDFNTDPQNLKSNPDFILKNNMQYYTNQVQELDKKYQEYIKNNPEFIDEAMVRGSDPFHRFLGQQKLQMPELPNNTTWDQYKSNNVVNTNKSNNVVNTNKSNNVVNTNKSNNVVKPKFKAPPSKRTIPKLNKQETNQLDKDLESSNPNTRYKAKKREYDMFVNELLNTKYSNDAAGRAKAQYEVDQLLGPNYWKKYGGLTKYNPGGPTENTFDNLPIVPGLQPLNSFETGFNPEGINPYTEANNFEQIDEYDEVTQRYKNKDQYDIDTNKALALTNLGLNAGAFIAEQFDAGNNQQLAMQNLTADNLYNQNYRRNRGDYDTNSGLYQPGKMGQMFAQYGGYLEDDEVEMTEEEIQEFLRNGGQIEYL